MVFEKKETGIIAGFLFGLNIEKNKKLSRLRTRVANRFSDLDEALQKERLELFKDFAEKDTDGEVIVAEDGSFKLKDVKGAEKELTVLLEEKISMDVGDYSNNVKPLMDYLYSDDYEFDLEGANAYAYDCLLTAWEESQEETGEEE